MERQGDRSVHISGPVANAPTFSGNFHGPVTVNYGQEQLAEKVIKYKRPPKPSRFHGESTKIFVGRKQDIDTIKNYFIESNDPVSITGEGGIGKSELAYKAIHKCEDMFDLIIPIYFGSHLTFE